MKSHVSQEGDAGTPLGSVINLSLSRPKARNRLRSEHPAVEIVVEHLSRDRIAEADLSFDLIEYPHVSRLGQSAPAHGVPPLLLPSNSRSAALYPAARHQSSGTITAE
jgi:hypothetical protein